jgi:hypothetical protein
LVWDERAFRQELLVDLKETILDIGQLVIKNLTQEGRNYVNNANMIVLYSLE